MTDILTPDDEGVARAAAILARGGLVALPTETVYGLGADARDDRAVAAIFAAKDRPRFNPLIVHLPDVAAAQRLTRWNDAADRLAAAFWPGPLTLVLPLAEGHGLSSLVTAGLPTVALRLPDQAATRAVLNRFGGPVAAPSANPSGRVSPTEAAHVLAGLGGRIDAVLDAGPCPVGVESTILALTPEPELLRPGGLPLEAIEECLGRPVRRAAEDAPVTAPGQLRSHYAPRARLRLNARTARPGERLVGFGPTPGATATLSASGDLTEAAANLFRLLHDLDAADATDIAVAPVPDHGLGRAINDRLRRAAAPRPEDAVD